MPFALFDSRRLRLRADAIIGVALLGLSLISLLAAFPTTRSAMIAVESSLTLALNDTLGLFAPWDWFVILGAHPGILFAAMGSLLALFSIEGWLIRRSDYGRLYGYGLLVLLLAFGVGLVVDVVSFRLAQRISPWMVLGGVDDLRRFYTTDFLSMSTADGYVDGNLVAWSCAAVFLWNRARRTASVMLAFVTLHGFSEIALGEQWPVAHVLAVLIGMAIGGVGLLRHDALFAQAERHMEDFFVARAWRRLTPVTLRAEPSTPASLTSRVLLNRPRGPRGRQETERLWLRLIEREVLPVVSLQPGDYVLTRHPPLDLETRFKRSRYVRFLRTPRGEVFVVKAAWRWSSPLAPAGRILRYRLHARNAIALERLQFPVPRLYWVREGFMNFGLRRFFLLVEEFVPGRPLDRKSFDEVSGAIRLLAQLHENKRLAWGPISEAGTASVEQYIWTSLRPRIMYSLARLQKQYGSDWPPDLGPRVWGWFEAAAFRLAGPDGVPFRLTHGDVTRNNFLVAPDGMKMLDLLTLSYEWAGSEILKSCISFSHAQNDRRRDLWIAYFREAGDARWREFLRQSGVAAGFHLLREFAQGRAFASADPAALPAPDAFARRLHFLLTDVALWGASPDQTDWTTLDALLNRPLGSLRIDHPQRGARVLDAPASASSAPA